MASRIIVRIELTPAAKDRVNELCRKTGMTQVAMLSRLIEWFASEPETVQAAALGQYPPEIAPDVARLILKRMAAQKPE